MRRSNVRLGIFLGILLLLACHILLFAVLVALSTIWQDLFGIALGAFLFIGVTQLFYVGPLMLICHSRRRHSLAKGVVIGALITAFLNGSCFLLLATT
ncbi:MAG: hypothetical protein AAFQ40_04940 [Cyanobacteria bacterium J06623_5]